MPQTLLALLALVLASYLTISQQRHQVNGYSDRIGNELRIAGAGMATHIMEMIAARSFDEASTPLAVEARDASSGNALPTVTDFSSTSDFGELKDQNDGAASTNSKIIAKLQTLMGKAIGFREKYSSLTGQGCLLLTRTLSCDDVDDVDGLRNETVYVELSNGHQLEFFVDVDVFYVEQDAPETPVTGPTLNKRVELTLRSPYVKDPTGQNTEIVTLERVITYDPLKADHEHEHDCGPMDGLTDLPACLANYEQE